MSETPEIIRELRSALAHLDQPLYLETHALTKRLAYVAETPEVSRGRVLRRVLRAAIESLDPGAGVPANSPEARAYQVLYRYAVAQQGMVAIASELDIGERQAYRELHQALATLASILFPDDPALLEVCALPSAASRRRAALVREEVERLSSEQVQDIVLSELVSGVVDSARRLAQERGVEVCTRDEAPGLQVTSNRTVLRQALLNLMSHMVRREQHAVTVHLYCSGNDVVIKFTGCRGVSAVPALPNDPFAVAVQLLETLSLRWSADPSADGLAPVAVYVPISQEHSVLIVDDNEGLVTLFRRYLRGQPYHVHDVTDATRALQEALRLQPDVIILDVMMPRRDGWEVLEALRASAEGRRTRIIVCSVINDPHLAVALGADAFLHKPVDRARLLRTLAQVLSPARA